jgi:hypothetical protein
MINERLSEYFSGAAVKRLSAVETRSDVSHQHELNGVQGLRAILGESKQSFDASFLRITDDSDTPLTDQASMTWYDARENQPRRSTEFRLYFRPNAVMAEANEGDTIAVLRRADDSLVVIVAAAGTTAEHQLLLLLQADAITDRFDTKRVTDEDREVGFVERMILESLGVETKPSAADRLDEMIARFGAAFPSTRDFSEYARSTCAIADVRRDPDRTLLEWYEQEELLFKALERHIVGERLTSGFSDVDEFVRYSLAVQNRRKARAGFALENHVEEILRRLEVRYSRGALTESPARPDFLFPSAVAYRDSSFPESHLTMLGVKSTCKDRWRQVLSEAARIRQKHLLTLEPGITEAQTGEMQSHRLILIVPDAIHGTYTSRQRERMLNVGRFIALVEARQASVT